ncbi:hypothetical protein [Mailhella sp.]|uniref:hypothetical protein n=1 Tax=Mailhella sp. TaxID=1981029 RepID=UPI003AB3CED1
MNEYPLLLPHLPPIRMIDALDEADDERFASHVTIPQDSPYVTSGILCPEALLEVMAQCFAAGMGCKAGKAEPDAGAAWGYLASIRNFEIRENAHAGDRLVARCALRMRVGSIWVVEGQVLRRDEEIARAQFKIYIPRD